ncbi:MAG TPA: hypothetical protein VED18_08255 [Candidatus Sulfotelmatobacter sp.]|nr:hypothetical protein [Candidatus Sulfotelmatobacter sp.]
MKTITETQELFCQFPAKTMEALTLWAEANQKVFRDLADLSANTAKEGARLFAELQASAVEAVKEGQAYWLQRQGEGDVWQKDPFAWYQKSLLEGTERTQKAFKLVEGNAQAIARSAERVQATAEQTAREIQQTFASVAEKAKALYAPTQN